MKTIVLVLIAGCFALAQAQTTDEQNIFRLAQSYEQGGDLERAGQLYEQLNRSNPGNFVYFDALRRNYTQRKKYDEAIALCLARFASQPGDINVKTALAGIYAMSGRSMQADSMWNAVLQSAPKNAGVYRLVATEQAQLRMLDKAVQTLKRGRTELGDKYAFANDLASLFTTMMNFRGAADEYLLMLEQNEFQLDYVESRLSTLTGRPEGLQAAIDAARAYAEDRKESVVFLRVLAWLWMEAKQYDEAFGVTETIENRINSGGTELFVFAERVFRENAYGPAAKAYRKALDAGSESSFAPQAKLGYARCMEELSAQADSAGGREGSVRTVLALYESLTREYPMSEIHAQALYRIGTIRASRLGDLNGALAAYDSITVIAPASPMLSVVRAAMGDVYLRQGKTDDARVQYDAVAGSPQSSDQQRSDARYRMAELLFYQAKFDSALTMLTGLTANVQSDEANDALILQAFILENKDAFESALESYARAEFLARQGKLSEAIAVLNDVILQSGEAPLCDDAMLKKAEYETKIKRPVDALRTLQGLLSAFPKSTERDKAQFRIGEIYQYSMQDKGNAIAAYSAILAEYPNSLFIDEARRRIRALRGDS
ncbi:MAG: tetratricopeptide repeat protein [Acidobacteriota bacterium]